MTNANTCSILVSNETQKDPSSNGAGTPSDRSSYIHTNSMPEGKGFETQNALAIILHNLFFLVKQFQAFRCDFHLVVLAYIFFEKYFPFHGEN